MTHQIAMADNVVQSRGIIDIVCLYKTQTL